jgi:hypothetical protein
MEFITENNPAKDFVKVAIYENGEFDRYENKTRLTGFEKGQIINYTNGNLGVYEAKIIDVEHEKLLICDTDSCLNVYNHIFPSQVV